jgi:predicted peptidase
MTRKRLRFAAAAIVVMAWAAGTTPHTTFAQTQAAQLRVFDSGVHIDTFRRTGDLTVQYAISIPKNYSPSNPVPLVLALHYGGNPNGAAQGVLLALVQPAFAELGAIIVAPESVRGAWSTAENERAVNALLDAVQASYRIDTKKIAVTGFSMGGTGVWFFARKYPERFSAAVPVAGMPPATAADWRTPVFAVHSRNDEVMPIEPTETRIKELQKRGVRAELVALTGISHYETNRFVEGLRRAVPWLRETWK